MYNILTPGTSLEPEDARIEADQARRAAEAEAVNNPKDNQVIREANDNKGNNDYNLDSGDEDKEEREARKRVIGYDLKYY
jgi:hypothetical protein